VGRLEIGQLDENRFEGEQKGAADRQEDAGFPAVFGGG